MTRKQRRTPTEPTPQPAAAPDARAAADDHSAPVPTAGDHLAGQVVRGAAAGTARAVTEWIIRRITEHVD